LPAPEFPPYPDLPDMDSPVCAVDLRFAVDS
jgi:hypothetical protein